MLTRTIAAGPIVWNMEYNKIVQSDTNVIYIQVFHAKNVNYTLTQRASPFYFSLST